MELTKNIDSLACITNKLTNNLIYITNNIFFKFSNFLFSFFHLKQCLITKKFHHTFLYSFITPMSYKTTNRQYEIILAFMQKHGDLCAPSRGAKKRALQIELWTELTNELNHVSAGYTKTMDKWIKVWCDWKTRTKKKVLDNTLPGKHSKASLTVLEDQLMAFLGWNGEITSHDNETRQTKQNNDTCCYEQLKIEKADDTNIAWNKINKSKPDDAVTDGMQPAHFQANKFNFEKTFDCHLVDSKDTEKAVAKITRSHSLHKKMKRRQKTTDDTVSILEQIIEKFFKAEQRRLEVDLIRQRNDARREENSFKQSQKNHVQILDFTENYKKTFTTILNIYSNNQSKK